MRLDACGEPFEEGRDRRNCPRGAKTAPWDSFVGPLFSLAAGFEAKGGRERKVVERVRDIFEKAGERESSSSPLDGWINDPDTVASVRELYAPSSEIRAKMEGDRRVFLNAMAQVKQGIIFGVDKNTYVEPTIWTIEWAQHFYKYPITRSN